MGEGICTGSTNARKTRTSNHSTNYRQTKWDSQQHGWFQVPPRK